MADANDPSVTDDIWASPTADQKDRPRTPRTPKTPTPRDRDPPPAQNPEDALKTELASVRAINESIETVIKTLGKAKQNMGVSAIPSPNSAEEADLPKTVSDTVSDASTLLNTWTRILSQTEHNQRLILDPAWRGSTQDLQDAENETLQRQLLAERKAVEEERRKEERRRRAEDEERQRAVAQATPRARGSTRGRGRARGAYSSGYGVGGTSSSSAGGSRIGRGAARGRARAPR